MPGLLEAPAGLLDGTNGGLLDVLSGRPPRGGIAENVPHPLLYEISRLIQRNPTSDFLLNGLADWMQTTAKGGRTSYGQDVMAGLDAVPLDPAALTGKLAGLLGMTVYHGSPHLFNKFSPSKIGTGEGAQAYGHGLYFAENPAVAGAYKKSNVSVLGPRGPVPEEVQKAIRDLGKLGFDSPGSALNAMETHPDWMQRWDVDPRRSDVEARAVSTIQKYMRDNPRGHLYHADIPDSAIDNMLDWDKPLSEQSENVRVALKTLLPKLPDVATGAQIYGALKNRAMSAVFELRRIGIPGIKYLDQGSRTSGKGTRNIVLFDENLAKITKRE